jgi:hypothetical protein
MADGGDPLAGAAPPATVDLFQGSGKGPKNNFKVVVRVRPSIEREATFTKCVVVPTDTVIEVSKVRPGPISRPLG